MMNSRGPIFLLLRQALAGSGVRIVGVPIVAVIGLYNTSLIVAQTGVSTYGIVNTVATLGALLPFADLGIGGSVTTAVALRSQLRAGEPLVQERIAGAYKVLICVAAALVLTSIGMGFFGLWDEVFGRNIDPRDQWIVSIGFMIFAAGIPCGLGARILVGLGRNALAVFIGMTSSLFALVSTLSLMLLSSLPMSFALSGFIGALISNVIASFIGLRLLKREGVVLLKPFSRLKRFPIRKLLSGSGWLFVVTIGLPLGLETGRLVLSHRSTSIQLSEFALASQIYVLAWSVIATSAGALWTIFAQKRSRPRESYYIWRLMVGVFGVGGLVAGFLLWKIGPYLGHVISRGEIAIGEDTFLAFGLLLLAQSLHLPAGSMLTKPVELRYQAICVAVMATLSLSIGVVFSATYGAPIIAFGAAVGVFAGQFVPDIVAVRRFLFHTDR
ncbi:hypothetical protein ACP3TD_15770 [Pseudarthrobacter sp. 1G09]|uniref:hypothetical protein n=1 Tax=Pseudarthrobacter sp. 1G09 TaxID=3416178 RepID=UPI003CFA6873